MIEQVHATKGGQLEPTIEPTSPTVGQLELREFIQRVELVITAFYRC
jgi:hypothetical protein